MSPPPDPTVSTTSTDAVEVLDRVLHAAGALRRRDAGDPVSILTPDRRWAVDGVLSTLVRLAHALADEQAPAHRQVELRVQACAALTHAAFCCEQLLDDAGVERDPTERLVDIRPWEGDRTFGVRWTRPRELAALAETVLVLRQAAAPESDEVVLLLASALAIDTARETLGGAIALRLGSPDPTDRHRERSRWIMEEVTDRELGRAWQDAMSGRVRSPTRLLLGAMPLQLAGERCGPADELLRTGEEAAANLAVMRSALVSFARDVLAAGRAMSTAGRLAAPETDALVLDAARMLDALPVIHGIAPEQRTVRAMSEAAHGAAAFVLRHCWELVAAPDAMRDVLVQDKLRLAIVDAMCAIALIDEYHDDVRDGNAPGGP